MLARAALRRLATASAAASSAAAPRHGVRSVSALTAIAQTELAGIKEAGTYKAERVITSPQSAHIRVSNRECPAARCRWLAARADRDFHPRPFPNSSLALPPSHARSRPPLARAQRASPC